MKCRSFGAPIRSILVIWYEING
ncbi:protein of unknown function [Methylorubrum extorquens]|uniref:Uncharacterized protein n=1 Tax=Methylorubrum extorquens TaxID=408 RepID=A0A2N9AXW7_METEX|nr:protein of unknown function [Methylorubrum extorquens]